MAHLPEDRIKMGIVLPFSVAENMILHEYNHAPYSRKGFLAFGNISGTPGTLVDKFDVRTAGVDTEIQNLSGGNQQKVVVARELQRDPRFMLVSQPTRGIDIGATEFVLQQILAAARSRLGDPAHLDRAGRAVRGQRPHPGDVRGPDRRRGPGRPEPHGRRRPDDGRQAGKVNPHPSPNPSLERAASPDVARSVFSCLFDRLTTCVVRIRINEQMSEASPG